MSGSFPQLAIQQPDILGGLARVQGIQANRLQMLAAQQDMEAQRAFNEAGPGLAGALASAEGPQRQNILAKIAGLGSRGLAMAMPLMEGDRQEARQRQRPLTAEEAAQYGLRPGTVALTDGAGRLNIAQQPDTMSDAAMAQRLRLTAAGRAPTVQWRDEVDAEGNVIGQRSSSGQFVPRQRDPNMFGGGASGLALEFLTRNAEAYQAGLMPPDRRRQFEAALALYQQPRTTFDPASGQMVTITPPLPPFLAQGAQPATQQPPQMAPQAPGAPQPQAPAQLPQQPPALPQGAGVPIGQTGMVAVPPTPSTGGVTVTQAAAPRQGEPTGEERMAAGYAQRMLAAEQLLGNAVRGGYVEGNVRDAVASSVPVVGNFLGSAQGQLYRQAQEDWVRAKLRRESGAVIGEEEMAREIQTYFPRPGDTPATIAQKADARRVASEAMINASGRQPVPRPDPARGGPVADPLGILGNRR